MNNKRCLWLIIPFMLTICTVGIINLLTLDKTQSDAENRTLQQRPGVQNIIDKDYSKLYESYYTDQFIGRDNLLKLFTKMEIAMNKSTIRGHYIINNEWILPHKIGKKDSTNLSNLANKLNNIAMDLKNDNKDVYFVSTPSKIIALNHLYPKYSEKGYGMENLEEFTSQLDYKNINLINIDKYFKESFNNEQLESLYFKTDHHWNGLGAFEGFKYIMGKMNYLDKENTNKIFSGYEKMVETNKLFLGSYNRNLFSLFGKNEEIPYMYNSNAKEYEYFNYNGNEYVPMEKELLISTEMKFDEVTYGGAYTYDIPLYKIVNTDAPIKKKILIVKDSFQTPTTLMFADFFESVEILDPRNSLGLLSSNVIKESNPDIVMFMFNSETFDSMIDVVN